MEAQKWVDALYRDLLGRTPDPAGLAFWTQQTLMMENHDGRAAVAFAFLSNSEVDHKLLNSNYPGTVSAGAPGSPALDVHGEYALSDVTGDGWESLYFQGNLDAAVVDSLYDQLQAGAFYGETIARMLETSQYFGRGVSGLANGR